MTPMFQELLAAVDDLNARGLAQAAHWAAEQLCGLGEEPQHQQQQPNQKPAAPHSTRYLLARSHFDFKEYQRAAHVLQGATEPCARFLRLYSAFLAGEKTKEQERVEKAGSLGRVSGCANPNLEELHRLLVEARQGEGAEDDAFLMYLHGVVLLDRKKHKEAEELLLRSLHAYPCNWSAWQALRPLCSSAAALQALQLPNHWARDFFLASVLLELQQNQEALGRLQRLSQIFPHSTYMESLLAQAHYNLQNYDEAQSLFEDILSKDPFRLEGMDVFSNILFVKEQFAALSQLAHRAVATDKYCPEACCIVGNYYSLKGQHEKAVEYFRRALRLNCSYLAAWTLMGHEHMEMKNTQAAIEAYRRAVDLNPQDFRAWYGLGQAYELLKTPVYAVYYYKRAAALRPQDARMWCALGQCYMSDQVALQEQAIRCYRRAIEYNDPDGIAAHMLAKLYESRHEYAAAEQLYRYNLARLEQLGQPLGTDAVEALLFLAGVCKDSGRLAEAQACCERLLDVGGAAKERAKALAREIHALQQQEQQQPQQLGVPGRLPSGKPPQPLPLQQQQPWTPGPSGLMGLQLSFPPASAGGSKEQEQESDVMEDVAADPSGWGRAMPSRAGAAASTPPVFGQGGGEGMLQTSAAPVEPGSQVMEAGQGQSRLALAAVMQQLRVGRDQAIELLMQSDGDPLRAIVEHLNASEQ